MSVVGGGLTWRVVGGGGLASNVETAREYR